VSGYVAPETYSIALPMKPKVGTDSGSIVVFCKGCPTQSNVGGESCCTLTVWFCAFGDRLRAAADGFTVWDIATFVLSNPKEAVLKNQTATRMMSCPSKLNVGLVTLAVRVFCIVLALKLNVGPDIPAVSAFCRVLALKVNVELVTLAVSAFCRVLALKLKDAADIPAVSAFCRVLALKVNVGLVTLAVRVFCIVLALKLKDAADKSIVVAPEGAT
jgi:hypothetical protein